MITLLCVKGGVTFSETEERCLRASPLTLTGFLKTPAQGEEVERARKGKRASIEMLREVEEIWGFEDYLEQPVLSPRAEETMPAQNRAESGKSIVEEQESSNYELFSLLTEMSSSRKS